MPRAIQVLLLASFSLPFLLFAGCGRADRPKEMSDKPTVKVAEDVLILPEPIWLAPKKEEQVNLAIEKGVNYLKGILARNGASPYSTGRFEFIGLTLLHCGVSPDATAVKDAVRQARANVVEDNFIYRLAISLLLLDRYEAVRPNPKNVEAIRKLALRLMSAQDHGAWGGRDYHIGSGPAADDEAVFIDMLRAWKTPDAGTPKTIAHCSVLHYVKGTKPGKPVGYTDNSCTQFVTLALWAARRHGLPVERSLAMTDAFFRATQNEDGSWQYFHTHGGRKDGFTCAGLLGLAVGRGVGVNNTAWGKDEAVAKALRFLAKNVGCKPTRVAPGTGPLIPVDTSSPLCYLYSLERVGMLYGLRAIEGKEWYSWGVDVLLPVQNADGSWNDRNTVEIDTCFALLFLRRANLTQDLSDHLQSRKE